MGTEEGTAETEFHDRLRAAVRDATENGVEVEGSWPVLSDDPDAPDWDVEIVLLDESED
ncbi:MAG TPA: hypothetical protein VJ898_15140 [Natrialbaceae archaeon]|nr:hypothetical protein [Natrialbaceae archaeon]